MAKDRVRLESSLEVLTNWDSDIWSPGVCDNEAFWSIKPFAANPAGTQMALCAAPVDLSS